MTIKNTSSLDEMEDRGLVSHHRFHPSLLQISPALNGCCGLPPIDSLAVSEASAGPSRIADLSALSFFFLRLVIGKMIPRQRRELVYNARDRWSL